MQLSQPTLEPHSLCYTCWVQVVYSLLPTQLFSSCSLWGHPTATQFPATRRSSPGATRSTRTSRRSSPSQRPCGALLSSFVLVLYASTVSDIFVINVINNICFRFKSSSLSALSAETILLLYPMTSKILTRLAFISLYRIVSVDLWPEESRLTIIGVS